MSIITCARCGAKNRVDEGAATSRQAVCGRCGAALADGAGEAQVGQPEILTDAEFEGTVLRAAGPPVLVDFWAEWCGPCRMIAPALEQLAAESQGRYRIAKLNVDENPRTASRYGVRSIPTLIIFKGGNEVDRLVGALPKQAIAARLAAHV
jgi:thioredoxin 2